MKYAKPKKGNRHELTVNQHIFPARSLQRFTNSQGTVHVMRTGWASPKRLPPDNPMFVVKRAWDQRAEQGYMKQVEDGFQALADQILLAGQYSLGPADYELISAFYALWRLRAEHRENPLPDQQMQGVTGTSFTDDERDKFEKHGVLFHDAKGALPGRMVAGMAIQMAIDRITDDLKGKKWGIAVAKAGEFMVPDYVGIMTVVPLSPLHYLIADSDNVALSLADVEKLNRFVTGAARRYLVARDFAKCPPIMKGT